MSLMFNDSLLSTVLDALLAMSSWEVVAAILGIGYVVLAAKASQWCWPLAFISTFIYTILFWDDQLPMQAMLNFYYMGMAVYGYLLWRQHGRQEDDLQISSWSSLEQFLFLAAGASLTVVSGFYLVQYAVSHNPFLDAAVMVFSVMNTVLMIQKVLQSWLYWIVIDAAAIMLYTQNSYYATVVMYGIYLILAMIGYLSWRKLYHQSTLMDML